MKARSTMRFDGHARWAYLLGLAALVVARLHWGDTAKAAEDRPRLNVLLIVADDQDCQLGCYGNKVIRTPHIDRLASRGVRFDRAYCNYPVCNPSRASFLSGRFPNTTQVFGNGTPIRVALGEEFQFLPEYFSSQGYFTGAAGKIAHPTFAGSLKWDEFTDPQKESGQASDDDDAPPRRRAQRRNAARTNEPDVPFGWAATDNQDEDEPDGISATRVIRMLESQRDQPFFIAAGFHKPHVPHTAPKKYFDMYDPAQMPLPVEPAGHADGIPAIARPPKYYPELTREQSQAVIQHYYAASTFMDAQVGRILATLDRLNLWDKTVVVFIGDHGWHHGEHAGFWAKSSLMRESGITPLIIAAPGRTTNAGCNRVVQFVDLFPTLTELAGVPAPQGLEGTSLAPLLNDPQQPWDKPAFGVVTRGNKLGRAVWTEEYTYLAWPDGSRQLYRAASDPHEYVNLAEVPEHGAIVAELHARLDAGPTKGNDNVPKRKAP